MYVIVVRVRKCLGVFIPIVLVIVHIISQHGNQRSVVPLDLPIRLGMICGDEPIFDAEMTANVLGKLRREVLCIVAQEVPRWSVFENPNANKKQPLGCKR